MENENDLLTDMKVEVTVGGFHRTHDVAGLAETIVAKGNLDKLLTSKLLNFLKNLEAGQRLTDAETGPDFMFAHSYTDSIRAVEKEIKRRR
jgi:hypothetical protein